MAKDKEPYDSPICQKCEGSGESMTDGSTCCVCKGSGVEKKSVDNGDEWVSMSWERDIQELAAHILDINDEDDDYENLIDIQLNEQFSIDFDNFSAIIEALLPLITVAESPLTKTRYKGFSYNDLWLLKMQADE
jgi:hypothetical protein